MKILILRKLLVNYCNKAGGVMLKLLVKHLSVMQLHLTVVKFRCHLMW